MLVAGVDGCPAGWVVVTLDPRDGALSVEVVPTIAPVIERVVAGELALAGVDIPMGLPDAGRRACDVEARARLGPRRSSVFPTPVRAALDAPDYPTALARSRAVDGRGLSKQAFHLLPKIAELDAVLTSALQDRIVECHPESCFARLAGHPLTTTKRTAAGREERLGLVERHAGDVGAPGWTRVRGARPDDVLDAAAVALVMGRHRQGRATVLGDGTRDARGLLMQIVV